MKSLSDIIASGFASNASAFAGGGTGDVVGPASATDNAVARFDGTTGELLQDSKFVVDDDGSVGIGSAPFTSGTTRSFTIGGTMYGGIKGYFATKTVTGVETTRMTSGNTSGSLLVASADGAKYLSIVTGDPYNNTLEFFGSVLDIAGFGGTVNGNIAHFTMDGQFLLGTSTAGGTSLLKVAGQIESTTGGFKFPDASVQITAATGTNTGDQTSIVGIAGTLSQFDAACTDANFLSTAAAAAAYQPLDAQLTDLAALAYASNALKVVRVNAGATGFELATVAGGGSGDVVGPGSATDNALARFDATTGKLVQNSGVIADDNADIRFGLDGNGSTINLTANYYGTIYVGPGLHNTSALNFSGTFLGIGQCLRIGANSSTGDLSLSRISAGVAALGNGTTGDFSAELKLTTLRFADGSAQTTAATGGGTRGVTTVNFGAFPGASDASATITGQAGIAAGSRVRAWIEATATADHSADEHWLETIDVIAGNIDDATGFTIYAKNTGTLAEPVREQWAETRLAGPGTGINQIRPDNGGGKGTRLYGQFTVAWEWI